MPDYFMAKHLAQQLERAVGLMKKIINQTERRVFMGEKVPASYCLHHIADRLFLRIIPGPVATDHNPLHRLTSNSPLPTPHFPLAPTQTRNRPERDQPILLH